jgi:hypothetical protein
MSCASFRFNFVFTESAAAHLEESTRKVAALSAGLAQPNFGANHR